jgi:two-component system response regulator FlrC
MEAVNIELFGYDPRVQKAVQFSSNVAVTKAPVLIVGEHGTGKKTLACFIHQQSNRASESVVIVDCSESPKDVENNILGYRDDASGRFVKGALERANKGSVVFANIDCLDEEFQKRLHKIILELEDYEIDVRLISTTTKNLSKLVGAGRFYRGLYTMLSGTQINLPPLRERKEDIKKLAMAYIKNACDDFDVNPVQIAPEALDKINDHYWTHNLSELKAVIENSLGSDHNGVLNIQDLAIGERKAVSMISENDDDGIKLMSLKDAEKLLIKKALVHTSENRTQAAKILGVSIRTLRNKINEYRTDGNQYFVNLR